MRKILMSFAVLLAGMNIVMAQLPVPIVVVIPRTPVKYFRNFRFSEGGTLIGLDPAADTGRAYKSAFIIDKKEDLDALKKEWKYINPSTAIPAAPLFKMYYVKDGMVKKDWMVFPATKNILTDDGYFELDEEVFNSLHEKFPLEYSIKTDTVKSRSEFAAFASAYQSKPSFLFIVEPAVNYEGSFLISWKSSASPGPEETEEALLKKINKAAGTSKYTLYAKPAGPGNSAQQKTYVLSCDKRLFNDLSDPVIEKGEWIPTVYLIKSYWRR